MGHIALYRKWRPQVWEDLVGQEHISRTLINAIETNRVTHAYLFCGSRGTGKTTTARILAKSLNCEARVDGSPCNKCPSCNDLSNSSSLDVIEIDAASNRGISEIKSLIEQVRFASVSGNYKVYIIDEFHMLTTEAFNAILKTLEEPPAKVVFVLATTEAHKILPTIISRCQRFDFQRITVSTLVARLRYISDQEGIIISDDSLLSIARKANGGLRDALSLLDQISSFSTGKGEIPTELVYQVLGLVSTDFLSKLAEAIANSEPVKIMQILSDLLKAGNDPIVIMTETVSFFRHLLVVKSAPETAEYLEVPVSNIEVLKKIGSLFSVDDILNCLEFLNEATERVKRTQMAQLWLEVNFVQLCKKRKLPDASVQPAIIQENNIPETVNSNNTNPSIVNDLMAKINEMEKRIAGLINGNLVIQRQNTVANNQTDDIKENINSYASDSPKNQLQPVVVPTNGDTDKTKYSVDFNSIWERILHETKKKSIPAAALLQNGALADVNAKVHTVTIKFENEGFIELLKKSKYLRVEQALDVVFGTPYKLIMEKGMIVKQEKKNHKLESDINTYSPASNNNQVTKPINETQIQNQGAVAVATRPPEVEEFQPAQINNFNNIASEITEAKIIAEEYIENITEPENIFPVESPVIFNSEVEVITQDNFIEPTEAEIVNINTNEIQYNPESFYANINEQQIDQQFIETEIQVKEAVDPYSVNVVSEEDSSQENLVTANNHKFKKSEKEIYFTEVADIFKGKIINKVKN